MYIARLRADLHACDAASRLARASGFAWLDANADSAHEDGRWSFMGCCPVEIRASRLGERPFDVLADMEGSAGDARAVGDADERAPSAEDVPRWIGYVAYDAWWSGRKGARHQRSALPVLRFARYDALLAFDHRNASGWLVGDDEASVERLRARLASAPLGTPCVVGAIASTEKAAHADAITRALAHIQAGDIYQINLARRFSATIAGSPWSLYLAMREASPVALGAYLQHENFTLMGRSMERFLRFRRRDGALWTCPIKGTLARAGRDEAEAAELRADPKEHAEHAMIVDLMRNDLGRVSRYGTVQVADLMRVERFKGLAHLVSTVTAGARDGLSLSALLEATFAPGSVTGTPKKRAMEIIEALEPHARGVYTGAYGFIDREGGLSLAVAIRTASVSDHEVVYWAGGGIVADSDVAKEIEETELKARVFVDACASLRS